MAEFLHLGDYKKAGDENGGMPIAVDTLSSNNSCIQKALCTIDGANQEITLIISEGHQDA